MSVTSSRGRISPADVVLSPLIPGYQFTDRIGNPAGSRTGSVAAMPAPHWFFRFMYDRESAAWERRRKRAGAS